MASKDYLKLLSKRCPSCNKFFNQQGEWKAFCSVSCEDKFRGNRERLIAASTAEQLHTAVRTIEAMAAHIRLLEKELKDFKDY